VVGFDPDDAGVREYGPAMSAPGRKCNPGLPANDCLDGLHSKPRFLTSKNMKKRKKGEGILHNCVGSVFHHMREVTPETNG
jgi:hypothetical protein